MKMMKHVIYYRIEIIRAINGVVNQNPFYQNFNSVKTETLMNDLFKPESTCTHINK